MKQYSLQISSKNEKSLQSFLHFFFNHLKTKFNIVQKLTTINNSKKVITLLKSPHVNKTAQEQFEIRIFTKQIQTRSFYSEKNLVFLRKILNRLFQDISFNLEFVTNINASYKTKLLVFYPDNFKLPKNKPCKTNLKRYKQKNRSKVLTIKKNSLCNMTKFLNVVSVFGEVVTIPALK